MSLFYKVKNPTKAKENALIQLTTSAATIA
jgi:hypothetical protein